MKKSLCLTLTSVLLLTTACGETADSSVKQIAETATEAVTKDVASVVDVAKEATASMSKDVAEVATKAIPTEKIVDAVKSATAKVEEKAKETVETVTEKVESKVAEVKEPMAAAHTQFIAGQHYDVLEEPIPTNTSTVKVSELFWYGCGHCFSLEPHMKKYRENLPKGATFEEVPAVFGNQWKFHAQVFYTAKALGLHEKTHPRIFDAIHIKKKRISTLKQVKDLFEPLGKDGDTVEKAFNSFAVDSNLRNAALFAQKSGARSVPTIIIDGKYRTSVSKAGGYDKLIEVMNHLVEKAKKERS